MGLLWIIFALLLLAVTKYVSSLNLKRLQTKINVDSHAAQVLREELAQLNDQEKELTTRINQLEGKEIGLRQLVDKLKNRLNAQPKTTTSPSAATAPAQTDPAPASVNPSDPAQA